MSKKRDPRSAARASKDGRFERQNVVSRLLCCLRFARFIVATAALLFALEGAAIWAMASTLDVDLELVLAVDVSGSMDFDEQTLQRRGYARALREPAVLRAIARGPHGRIALAYVEWGDRGRDRVTVPWTIVSTPAEAAEFAEQITRAPLVGHGLTSISNGLLFAAEQFNASSTRSYRKVVDVSGDGPNNFGPPIDAIRDRLVRAGITINGLALTLKGGEGFGWYPGRDPDILIDYYEDCVIGGPGAFLMAVNDPEQLGRAIRQKLVLEISGLPARILRTAQVVHSTQNDCQIGEKNLYPPDPGHPRPFNGWR